MVNVRLSLHAWTKTLPGFKIHVISLPSDQTLDTFRQSYLYGFCANIIIWLSCNAISDDHGHVQWNKHTVLFTWVRRIPLVHYWPPETPSLVCLLESKEFNFLLAVRLTRLLRSLSWRFNIEQLYLEKSWLTPSRRCFFSDSSILNSLSPFDSGL